jgi:hypothetical protein
MVCIKAKKSYSFLRNESKSQLCRLRTLFKQTLTFGSIFYSDHYLVILPKCKSLRKNRLLCQMDIPKDY